MFTLRQLAIFAIIVGSVCTSTASDLPRVSAIYWGKHGPRADLELTARFGFVIIGLPGNQAQMQSVIDALRLPNPNIKVGTYTVLVEFWMKSLPSDRRNFPVFSAIELNDWWVTDSTGQRVQWSAEYNTHLLNITRWAPKDPAGRRYPQWLGNYIAQVYGELDGLDYIFVDNVWFSPRPRSGAMDWERTGIPRSNSDPVVQSAYRQGTADYVAALRKSMPSKMIIGNADNDLESAEFKGMLDGAYLECAIGRSWSLENKGWAKMMEQYRKVLANTSGPKDVILESCGEGAPDLRLIRYGLTSALLEDGWFGYKIRGVKPAFYADEYSAPIGAAAEPPPTTASYSGIWLRRYANGMVLVNPGEKPASIEVGHGYQRLQGKQDPIVNNGQTATKVTLQPKDGLILLRR